MIKKQIGVLRKQLDETETSPSALKYPQLPRSMPVTPREAQRPSQTHGSQIPKDGGADSESYKRDIQSRAKAAVAYGRSFIA